MMEYAQLNEDGTEAIQITTHGNVEWDAKNFCSAEALTNDGKAGQFRVAPLAVTDPPEHNPLTQSAIRDGCEKVNGAWQYKWRIDELTAEQIEAIRVASIPQSISMRQACLQLEIDGLLDDVEAIVAGLPKLYQIEWQRASVVQRDNLLVETVRLQKSMTPAQIDALFVSAEKL